MVDDITPLLPQVVLLAMACIVMLVDLYLSDRQRGITYTLVQGTLVACAYMSYQLLDQAPIIIFSGAIKIDHFAALLNMMICILAFGVFVMSRDFIKHRNILLGEYYMLGLFSILGAMILTSANSLLTVYLGLECMSLPLYAMVAMQRDSKLACEAAIKYFVMGAMASGLLLFGISLIYGITGALGFQAVSAALIAGTNTGLVAPVALMFMLVGLCFKLGAVPFHMWMPDVYHGAPTSITAFLGTAPKLAAFAMMIRILIEALPSLQDYWQQMLMLMAVLSIGVGNVVAIAQTNIKRLFAYSAIAHMGYMLLGVLAGTEQGYSGAMFYMLVYSLMSLGGFSVVVLLSRKGFEAEQLQDYQGLAERYPWLALMMSLFLLSMAGIPPLVGFMAKFSVLAAIVSQGYIVLAAIAVLFSVIGAYYYLRLIKLMWFDPAPKTSDADRAVLQASVMGKKDLQFIISVNGLAMLGLAIGAGGLMQWCLQSFR